MLQLKYEDVMKSRGYGATLQGAYKMLTENIKPVFRHIWPYAAVYALLAGISFALPASTFDKPTPTVPLAVPIAVAILTMIASLLFYARSAMLINKKALKWNVVRMLKLWLWLLLFFVVFVIIVGGITSAYAYLGKSDVTSAALSVMAAESQTQMMTAKLLGVATLASVILFLFFLPLYYPFNAYIADDKIRLRTFLWKGYKAGLKNYGYIFLTLLLTYILIAVVMAVVWMPNTILLIAMNTSRAGVILGDPSGMPANIHLLWYSVSILSFFVFCFIATFLLFVGYFMYGSIKTRIVEANKDNLE